MSFIYSINKEYEWRVLFALFLVVFVVITVTLTIRPILETSRSLLLSEVVKRGAGYADEIKRINRKALAIKDIDRINTSFLNNSRNGIVFMTFLI